MTSPGNGSELDLRPLVRRVWAQRRVVLVTTVVAGVLGVLVSMVVPKWYRSTAVILPPEETDLTANLGVMGRALSKFPALGEFGEYTTPADIYKAILRSRTVQGEVVDRFQLLGVYRTKSRETALKRLAKSTGVKLNPDGTIEVYVEDRDPRRAAAMATGMLEALDHYNIAKRNTQGHRTRVFLERRVAEVDSALHATEVALREYQETHRTVAPVSAAQSGDVSSMADLMAQKIALEVRIGVLRGYLREDNDQLVQARRQLAELERQIGRIPALQSDLQRLMRDNKLQEQLYLLLSAELEDARVKEMRDTPTVSVLDAPAVPEKHQGPRKSLFGLVAAMLAAVGASVVVMRREPGSPQA
ncbi:MAG: hypothetical protein RL760_1026 [Candidatus Eisenbacteria bacterium]